MSEILEELAQDVASEVLHHIDTMYPKMWEGVPASARLSLRNTIQSAVRRRIFVDGIEEKLS